MSEPQPTTEPDTPEDPAVEFLASLLPREPAVRKRAFSALLRAMISDRSAR